MPMLEDVKIRMPKTEKGIKNSYVSCEKRGKFVSDTPNHHRKRLKKSKHDLQCAIDELKQGNWDWTIIKAYYAIHHAANALLSKKKNVFSKDHTCLIVSLKYHNLIDKKLFAELVSIFEGFSDTLSMDIAFEMRKIGQYDVDRWEKLTRDDAEKVLDLAKRFISYVEVELQ
jgi:uncharacterized protein (UPF0332 family)